MIKLEIKDKAYIAGFLDADGSIITQIVKSNNYKYGFSIRISIVFFQKTDKFWFLLKLKDKIKYGSLRQRNDGISEYTIVSSGPVKLILTELKDYLILKKDLAEYVLKIIEYKRNIKDKESFIEACSLVDKTATMTYSKKRKITALTVREYLDSNNIS